MIAASMTPLQQQTDVADETSILRIILFLLSKLTLLKLNIAEQNSSRHTISQKKVGRIALRGLRSWACAVLSCRLVGWRGAHIADTGFLNGF